MIDFQNIKEKLQSLVEEKLLAEPEFFLVDIKVLPSKKVQVFIDGDNGVQIDKCAKVSRHLEDYLDTEQPLGENYTLEVSSPGMSNPLKVLRQYKRRIGSEVEVLLLDGTKIEGILKSVNEKGIEVEEVLMEKKKEISRELHELLFSDFKSTKLKLNF